MNKERIGWVTLIVLIFIVVAVFWPAEQANNQHDETIAQNDSINAVQNQETNTQTGYTTQDVEEEAAMDTEAPSAQAGGEGNQGKGQLSQWEIQNFQQKNLEDPEEEIRQDLFNKPELIPIEGVLGGTMGFHSPENIELLNGQWALATYEDGHIMGQMLLKYEVSNNGEICWEVMDYTEP